MRMHRGSSKDGREPPRPTETLPLSASPPLVGVDLELTRAGSVDRRTVHVPLGAPVRAALRAAGQAPEGCAVLVGEVPIPLDTPIDGPVRLVVVSTFSGG
jgi:sulfur carrier protein ThiS